MLTDPIRTLYERAADYGAWLENRPRTAFFPFWVLFFIMSHLWNFRTAHWNGDALLTTNY